MSDKKAFLRWMLDEGSLSQEENIIYAEKAFFANSVVNWCIKKKKGKGLNKQQIDGCMSVLRLFLKGKLDLCWDNGIIKVQEKGLHCKGDTDGSDNLANTDKQ